MHHRAEILRADVDVDEDGRHLAGHREMCVGGSECDRLVRAQDKPRSRARLGECNLDRAGKRRGIGTWIDVNRVYAPVDEAPEEELCSGERPQVVRERACSVVNCLSFAFAFNIPVSTAGSSLRLRLRCRRLCLRCCRICAGLRDELRHLGAELSESWQTLRRDLAARMRQIDVDHVHYDCRPV